MSVDVDEIAQVFIEESLEGLDVCESGLLELTPGSTDSEAMNAIFRAAHSIKGGGATLGFTAIADFAHHVETLLDEIRQGEREPARELVDLLLESVDCMREMIGSIGAGEIDDRRVAPLTKALLQVLETPGAAAAGAAAPGQDNAGDDVAGWHIGVRPHADAYRAGADPAGILTTLRDLGDVTVTCIGADALDFDAADPTDCRLGWDVTLEGNVPREVLDELFSWVNDKADITLEAIPVPRPAATPAPAAAPAKPASAATAAPARAARPAAGEAGSIRVSIEKIDSLINLVGELVITQSMLSPFSGEFDFTRLPALREGLAQLSRNTRELQESVMAVRMLPIKFAFARFPRLVRDVCNDLGKQVELRLTGEATELDKTVLEKIGDPLVHLVRNSLDHGLETPDKRRAAGKPETGLLELSAYHQGGSIVIEVIDDGGGIDTDKVLAKARERGIVSADEAISEERAANLIFAPGFSTADAITDLSGRGVGLDVVRRNIADLGGDVSVSTERGKGSRFTIRLPLTLAILDGQLVQVGVESYIVPLVSIVETIQVTSEQVRRLAGGGELFRLRDEYLPVIRLHELFGVETDTQEIHEGLLVVAEAGGQRIGIFVDDLQEQQQVVIKSLESNYRQVRGISGATILGDGRVALIVDVPGLVQLFQDRAEKTAVA